MKSRECSGEEKKTPGPGPRGCLVLYSGGLDSILACRVLEEQGIRVTALEFTSPFFGEKRGDDPEKHVKKVRDKYGINLAVIDITDQYIPMLGNPPHGYGKHFNPCIDCKILMVHRALELLPEFNADFIATGEVIGQRPMSQRRDTLNCITNESRAGRLLLRPLCARSLGTTIPEEKGWVSVERLPHISGRGRRKQMELAAKFGIDDYPNPAGGCRLADPIQGKRLKEYFRKRPRMDGNDCRLAVTGRQFMLPGGWWLVTGRDERENNRIAALKKETDLFLESVNDPAPAGILRVFSEDVNAVPKPETVNLACSILLYYCKKCSGPLEIMAETRGTRDMLTAETPATKEQLAVFGIDD